MPPKQNTVYSSFKEKEIDKQKGMGKNQSHKISYISFITKFKNI